jgi:hypothetical protein
MKTPNAIFALMTLSTCAVHVGIAGELDPATLAAWNAYLENADAHLRDRVAGSRPFLWVDESQERQEHVRQGEVLVGPMVGNGVKGVPHGLVHDWIGAIFIPGARIKDLLAVVHDYDNYERMYRPVVASSE